MAKKLRMIKKWPAEIIGITSSMVIIGLVGGGGGAHLSLGGDCVSGNHHFMDMHFDNIAEDE